MSSSAWRLSIGAVALALASCGGRDQPVTLAPEFRCEGLVVRCHVIAWTVGAAWAARLEGTHIRCTCANA